MVVSVAEHRTEELLARASAAGVAAQPIGRTGGARCRIAVGGTPVVDVSVAEAEQVWEHGLARYFEEEAA